MRTQCGSLHTQTAFLFRCQSVLHTLVLVIADGSKCKRLKQRMIPNPDCALATPRKISKHTEEFVLESIK